MRLPLLLLAAAFLPLAAAAQEATVADGFGREVSLSEPPGRIVCLLINCAEELAFLGAPPPVGLAAGVHDVMAEAGTYGAAIEGVERIEDADGVDFEAVARLEPDLVIGSVEQAPLAEGIAPFYAIDLGPARYGELDLYLRDLRAYARLLGREEEAEDRVAKTLDRVEAYARRAPEARRSVAVIYLVEDGRSFWINPDCGLFLPRVALCAWEEGRDYLQAAAEFLLSIDPDALVVEDYGTGEAGTVARLLAEDPIWSGLAAAEAGRVALAGGNLAWMRTIGTVGPGFDALMPLVYPETFPGPLGEAEVAAALQE